MSNKIRIKLMDEGTIYDCDPDVNLDELVDAIIEEYHKFSVEMASFIAFIKINGLSVEDVVKVYARLFKISDNDQVVRYIGEHQEFDDDYLDLRY